jgi:hypothetical protein
MGAVRARMLTVLAATSLAACMGPAKPEYVDASFVPGEVDILVVLPLVDLRADRSRPVDPQLLAEQGFFTRAVDQMLQRRGYAPRYVRDYGVLQR